MIDLNLIFVFKGEVSSLSGYIMKKANKSENPVVSNQLICGWKR